MQITRQVHDVAVQQANNKLVVPYMDQCRPSTPTYVVMKMCAEMILCVF